MQIRTSSILFAFPLLLLLCSVAVTSAASIPRSGSIGLQDASDPFNKRMGPEDLKNKPEAVLNHHLEISKQNVQNLRDMVRKLRAGQSAGADEGALLIQKLPDDHRVTYNQMMDIFSELAATKLHL